LFGNDGEQALGEKLWRLGAGDHQLFFCPTSDRALPTAKATAQRRANHSRLTCLAQPAVLGQFQVAQQLVGARFCQLEMIFDSPFSAPK